MGLQSGERKHDDGIIALRNACPDGKTMENLAHLRTVLNSVRARVGITTNHRSATAQVLSFPANKVQDCRLLANASPESPKQHTQSQWPLAHQRLFAIKADIAALNDTVEDLLPAAHSSRQGEIKAIFIALFAIFNEFQENRSRDSQQRLLPFVTVALGLLEELDALFASLEVLSKAETATKNNL